jgi:dipeptidyl aminopeptidase/acylaminoacyl peptidase
MRRSACCLALLIFVVTTSAWADDKGKEDKKDEFTLERLFPEKGLFGTSARSTSVSHDGRYATYLYRSYKERRHGSDLFLYDFKTQKSERLTSVSVMAEFLKSARDVKDDRIKKAKAAAKKEAAQKKGKSDKSDSSEDKLTEEQQRGDWVSDKDADDEKAPKYGGIRSYQWSPVSHELLFIADGDVFRWKIGDKSPTRLTRTRASEATVRYLPDGKGCTYMANDALMRIMFDNPLIEQIDPKLPSEERMSGYQISPNGKRLAVVSRKGGERGNSGRKVSIVNYRDRFAKVTEVSRHMADDEKIEQTVSIYLFDMSDTWHENGKLVRVFSHQVSGPRDIVGTPRWAPDSSRIVFDVFEQDESEIHIREAIFPAADEKQDGGEKKEEKEKKDEDENGDEKKQKEVEQDKSRSSTERVEEKEAKILHRHLHTGGPTTPTMVDPEYLADSRRIVFLSEQSGFRQLHVLDPIYQSQQQLTSGYFEVYPVRISKDHKSMFVTSTKDHPAREHVYHVDLETSEMTRLVPQDGTYTSVAVSEDGKHVLASYVTFGKLKELYAIDVAKKKMQKLTDSHPEKAKIVTTVKPEFITYKNRHEQDIHAQLFKPEGWRAKDKRPLLIYVYGGPLGTRKMVVDGSYNSDSFLFAWYMAKKHGYVTCTIDPRGVSGYGALFEKANFEQVGRPQVEDLVDGVKFLVEKHGVDPKRVGMHGWSFGGFQTQMCLYTEPDVFAAGIAGAGPTEWENYNSWYTTGTIGTSRTGQTDLKKFSLLPLAKDLKAKLLLVHGMEDSNVLYQDTVRVYRELLKAGKETLVELFLDPTGGHGLGGDVERLGRSRKYEEFLLRTLGEGKK